MNHKYLHMFVNAFWNESSGMSGGDKRVIEILKKWHQSGMSDFQVIVYAPQKFIDLLIEENIDNVIFRCTAPRGSEKRGLFLSYIGRTVKAVCLLPRHDKTNRHCFYSTSDYFPDVVPCVIGRMSNKRARWLPLVFHIMENYRTRLGNKAINFISYYLQQFSLFLMKKKSDKILYESPLVYDYLVEEKGFRDTVMLRVDNGVETALIDAAEPYDEEKKQYDAIMLARLAPSKGIYDLPAVWSHVLKKNSAARLGIIGRGSDVVLKEFGRLCEQYHVTDWIDLLGFLDVDEAYSYLKSAKMFVFVSREEGWGISIAEAMTCGLPVVAFELPVYRHIFPKGIKLISNRDAKTMAEQINFWIDNPEERKKTASEGSEYVRTHYEWAQVAANEAQIIARYL
ncbi:MAG: glycosyltransferase family 4 protein [Lachnospiraceae bacterium]|nr:glycosyltransferase family 4 protein [Lachnospiraceae bacterium]